MAAAPLAALALVLLAGLPIPLGCTTIQPAELHKPLATARSFTIADRGNVFLKDQAPFRLVSGEIHYHRVPPPYWRDRLERVRALGCNAIQVYVPWNFHQPTPGPLGPASFAGWRNITAFCEAAADLGLLVLLRPGPYVCAEWDAGGLPAWLQQPIPAPGGGTTTMRLRSSDPPFLAAVDAWWGALLPLLAPLTYSRGGPIVMVQVENEYGSYGSDKNYLRHLAALVRWHLGDQVLQYTTDNASPVALAHGSLPEVYTAVDFGPGVSAVLAFGLQSAMNPPGQSPFFCSEYYSGWLTHWSETMANTTAPEVAATLADVLAYNGNTGSVNVYMAHGGTNFGPWAGANLINAGPDTAALLLPTRGPWARRGAAVDVLRQPASDNPWLPEVHLGHITSYDYDAPIGEAGTYGQLGIGGPSKFEAVRAAVGAAQGGGPLPCAPPAPALLAYGTVPLAQEAGVLQQLAALTPCCRGAAAAFDQARLPAAAPGGGGPVTSRSQAPEPIEAYGQYYGLVVYEARVPAALAEAGGELVLPPGVHDMAFVWYDGRYLGSSYRGGPTMYNVPPLKRQRRQQQQRRRHQAAGGDDLQGVLLQLLVEPMGRNNFALGEGGLGDLKGLMGGDVTMRGQPLTGWTVHHLCLSGNFTEQLQWGPTQPPATTAAAAAAAAGEGATAPRRACAAWLPAAPRRLLQGLGRRVARWIRAAAQRVGGRPGPRRAPAAAAGAAAHAPGAAAGVCSPAGSSCVAVRPPTYCPPGGGPKLYRGWLTVQRPPASNGSGGAAPHPPDTFVHMGGWFKGRVWINGRGLGRYWQSQGPQQALYVPGAWLRWADEGQEGQERRTQQQGGQQQQQAAAAREGRHRQQLLWDWLGRVPPGTGSNEVLVLELGGCRRPNWRPQVTFEAAPDFFGPPGGPSPYGDP